MKGILLLPLLLLLSVNATFAQAKKDTTIILINSTVIQLEATDALNDLYNFKFEKAEQQFRWFKQKYAWHPLPYFLMGLIQWWKIMPNPRDKRYDDRFIAYMDSSIMAAENLYKKHPEYRIEASFFLAASYGFKGRLYSDEDRKEWLKAAAEGKAALKYMEICREQNNLSPELLFGDALYNYFREWVPENYKSLKPIFWFFRKGDKQLGLKQLREVSYNAFYTRTEAMVWYMRIMAGYENNNQEAFHVADYLHRTFPDNPYFHRYYARMLYSTGNYPEMEKECKLILSRIDSSQVGYEGVSGRYASFFLGQFYDFKRNWNEAKKYYEMSVKYSEEVEATSSGYYLYSLIALGEICEKQKDKAGAKKYFTKVKKLAGRKDEAYKDAKRRLKQLEKAE